MILSPTITLSVIPYSMLARPMGTPCGPPKIRQVLFYLQTVQDERRCFYECSFEGCPGCGCPSFAVDESLEIPGWVLDHLRTHLQFYHSPVAGKD